MGSVNTELCSGEKIGTLPLVKYNCLNICKNIIFDISTISMLIKLNDACLLACENRAR